MYVKCLHDQHCSSALLVGGAFVSDLLDDTWSQMSSLSCSFFFVIIAHLAACYIPSIFIELCELTHH